MIRDWLNFNESNLSISFKEEIKNIRQYFLEYEDDDLVSYQIYVCGRLKEKDLLWSVNPNSGDFTRWSQLQTEEANRYLNDESYRQLFLQTNHLNKYPFVFCANIIIKSENSILDALGVEKLQDVLTTYNRLSDNYDKVLIDLDSKHKDYKPVALKVYFNPIVG